MEVVQILLSALAYIYIANASPNSASRLAMNKEGEVRENLPVCGVPQHQTNMTGRIVGGGEANKKEIPWMVSLRNTGGYHRCGGTIIDDLNVLTAAHCVYGVLAEDLVVVAGEHDVNANEGREQIFGVEKYMMHWRYDSTTAKNDIALLRLNTTIDFSKEGVGPVCLPTTCRGLEYEECTIAGWGTTSFMGNVSDVLLKAHTKVLVKQQCVKDLRHHFDQRREICALYCGIDTCQGDSGGPLTCLKQDRTHMLAGITSWGFGCANPDYPGVYTRVCAYLGWIKRMVNKP